MIKISKKGNHCDANRRALKPQIQRAAFALNFEANAHSPPIATSLLSTAVAATKKDDIVILCCNQTKYRSEYELNSFLTMGHTNYTIAMVDTTTPS
jgi:hypothetical protein